MGEFLAHGGTWGVHDEPPTAPGDRSTGRRGHGGGWQRGRHQRPPQSGRVARLRSMRAEWQWLAEGFETAEGWEAV